MIESSASLVDNSLVKAYNMKARAHFMLPIDGWSDIPSLSYGYHKSYFNQVFIECVQIWVIDNHVS